MPLGAHPEQGKMDDPLGIVGLRDAAGPKTLTREQVEFYDTHGFLTPVPVMSPAEALELRETLEAAEREHGDGANTLGADHASADWMHKLVTDPRILAIVEDIVGPDILCRSSSWLVKESDSGSYIGWHQDAQYWGIRPDHIVTVWLACSDVTEDAGPMQFAHGTHLEEHEHVDTHLVENRLSRGQEIGAWGIGPDALPTHVPTTKAILRPGEACLFHVRVAHNSYPNTSGDRRLGIPIRYMPPSTRNIIARQPALLVRGEDTHGNWDLLPPDGPSGFVYKPKPDGAATTVAGVEKAKPGVEMEDADNVRARQAQAQRDRRDRPKFLSSSAKL